MTPQVVHPNTTAEIDAGKLNPPFTRNLFPKMPGNCSSANNDVGSVPFIQPMGSRDYLLQTKFVQCMKSKWEEKMRSLNPPLPPLHKCVPRFFHHQTSPTQDEKRSNLFSQRQETEEENLKSHSHFKSIETQTSQILAHEIPYSENVKNCTEINEAAKKCALHVITNFELLDDSSTDHPHINSNTQHGPYQKKDRKSLVPLEKSIEGLLPVVQHNPQVLPQPPLPFESYVDGSEYEKSEMLERRNMDQAMSEHDFETGSYVTRINSETSKAQESSENHNNSQIIQEQYHEIKKSELGDTYSVVSSEKQLFNNSDEHLFMNKRKLSLNARRHSSVDNEGDDDDKSSIALEIDGRFPRRATINDNDHIILESLNQDFNDTVLQHDVETKSDQVFKSKSELNTTSNVNNNTKNIENILRNLSEESTYYTATSAIPGSSKVSDGKEESLHKSLEILKTRSYEVCHKCRKLVKPGEAIFQINNGHENLNVWHRWGCFVCHECQVQLGEMDHLFFEGEPYCYQHYVLVAHVPKCHACGEYIFDLSYTSAAGYFWHKDHFVCKSCRVPLVDTKYVGVHGNVFCFKCYDKGFVKVSLYRFESSTDM